MQKLKRIVLIVTRVLLGVVLLFALLVGVLRWQSRNVEIQYEQFGELESGDGKYIVTIETGNPVMPYGSHSVAVTVKNTSDSEVVVAKITKLANDGMGINSDNIRIRWINTETASVCLRGDEQRDAYLLIDVPGKKISETHEEC